MLFVCRFGLILRGKLTETNVIGNPSYREHLKTFECDILFILTVDLCDNICI